MALYKLSSGSMILRTSDGVWIPPDPRNTDYRAYLAWLAVPNTADPADPLPIPLTPQQVAQALLIDTGATAVVLRGLVALLATRFGITQSAVVTAIVNAAN